MNTPKLNDSQRFPSSEEIKMYLKNSYPAYDLLIKDITENPYLLNTEWRYYNDGKSWLCKVTHKKKTIFWLSVWDGFFKVGFYFTDKNRGGIEALEINSQIKSEFNESKLIGKLIPLTVNVFREDQVDDILKIVEYKKGLK